MSIKKIDVRSVHQITSAQVAVDLTSCVKELVENALDAHATNLEIKFKKYGLDGVEVVDNGDGIDQADLPFVTRKHHTSKIESFDDLDKVSTFGFRGEAMSSLCGLCDVSITTCTKERVPKATKLVYSQDGEIKNQSTSAGKKGTTVTLTNILSRAPVRRKDFERNYKREYSKALSMLQEYTVITIGCRISVTNTTSSNKRSPQFTTTGSTMNENIRQVYGAGSTDTLIPINFNIEWSSRSIMSKLKKPSETGESKITVDGFISRPVFGKGRQARDRQLFFVNNRPCDIAQMSKAFNEIYRAYNATEYPFIAVNLHMPASTFDVNVSPNKRTILLHQEDQLIEKVKEQLVDFFDHSGHVVPDSGKNLPVTPHSAAAPRSLAMFDPTNSLKSQSSPINQPQKLIGIRDDRDLSGLGSEPNTTGAEGDEEMEDENSSVTAQILADSSILGGDVDESLFVEDADIIEDPLVSASTEVDGELSEVVTHLADKRPKPNNNKPVKKRKVAFMDPSNPQSAQTLLSKFGFGVSAEERADLVPEDSDDSSDHDSETESDNQKTQTQTPVQEEHIPVDSDTEENAASDEETQSPRDDKDLQMEDAPIVDTESTVGRSIEILEVDEEESGNTVMAKDTYDITKRVSRIYSRTRYGETLNLSTKVAPSLELIRRQRDMQKLLETNKLTKSDIQDEGSATTKLGLTVSKSDFETMRIVGQFNKGFILVTKQSKDKKDLFIVDQHASDEIYNFEDIKTNVKMESQPLAIPRPLRLTPVEEITVSTHLSTIEKNGFKVSINEEAEPGNKCFLKCIPMSKNTKFDEKDLTELIYKIEQSPADGNVKCSKVRSMIAMRACRKSIMIGQALDKVTMSKVVKNLSSLDKPWNCPHGRPTLRHLMAIK